MTIYDRLLDFAKPIDVAPEETSYWSAPEKTLDPKLFGQGKHLKPTIRMALLNFLYGFWKNRYRDPESWSRVWIAGSGVSYQWSAARDPGDLDVLVGVDWVGFRQDNPDFRGLGDDEIATHLNKELHDDLWPETSDWDGYEVTFYVNPHSYDIRAIKPYAAYCLTDDSWTVPPQPHPLDLHPHDERWDMIVNQDLQQTNEILSKYNKARDEAFAVSNPGLRLNAEVTMRQSLRHAKNLFDDIHEGRKQAFGPQGQGYADFHEYRYKSAKGTGVMNALRELKSELDEAGDVDNQDLYGGLPDAHRSLVASALSRRFQR